MRPAGGVHLGMIVMCGMQLFWICCAQLPTGACSGRRLALFPFHLSLIQDHAEHFTVSEKTAAPAVEAISSKFQAFKLFFCLWKMQFQSFLQVIFQQIKVHKGESIPQMKWKHPINFQSLKTASFNLTLSFPSTKRFFYAATLLFQQVFVCVVCLRRDASKPHQAPFTVPSFVCQWFIISLMHVRLMKSGFKVAVQHRGPLAYYHSRPAIRVKHLPE